MADWLERRPRLGRDVFGRGAPEVEPSPVPLADISELLRACHRLIALATRERVYRPSPPPLWRVPDALLRIRALLAELPEGGTPLGCFLPRGGDRTGSALQRRAALASTLVAGLELGREGELALEQEAPFGPIATRRVTRSAVRDTPAPAGAERSAAGAATETSASAGPRRGRAGLALAGGIERTERFGT